MLKKSDGHSYLGLEGSGDFLLACAFNVPIVYRLDLRENRASVVMMEDHFLRIEKITSFFAPAS